MKPDRRESARNAGAMRRAIFLDRDGTLNVEVAKVVTPEDLIPIAGIGPAVRRINDSDYLAILVTNQAVIARGECDLPALERIHAKLRALLAEEGARLDAIYFCPHHPDWGPPCDCRKPKPGMVFAAQADFDIDFSRSWVIGDSTKDMELARNVGARCALVRTGKGTSEVEPDAAFDTLGAAVDWIMDRH